MLVLAVLFMFMTRMSVVASDNSSLVTFVFGDSLTEVGNNNHLQYSLARSDYPWYGIDFSGRQATGRFTNGRTIGDIICIMILTIYIYIYILNFVYGVFYMQFWMLLFRFAAAKLGIPSPPAYLSVSNDDDALLKGVNYASGGAGILNDTGLYFVIFTFLSWIASILITWNIIFLMLIKLTILQIQRLSFDDQINYFKKTKEQIKGKIGEEAANKLCNEAMYFVGLGTTLIA